MVWVPFCLGHRPSAAQFTFCAVSLGDYSTPASLPLTLALAPCISPFGPVRPPAAAGALNPVINSRTAHSVSAVYLLRACLGACSNTAWPWHAKDDTSCSRSCCFWQQGRRVAVSCRPMTRSRTSSCERNRPPPNAAAAACRRLPASIIPCCLPSAARRGATRRHCAHGSLLHHRAGQGALLRPRWPLPPAPPPCQRVRYAPPPSTPCLAALPTTIGCWRRCSPRRTTPSSRAPE